MIVEEPSIVQRARELGKGTIPELDRPQAVTCLRRIRAHGYLAGLAPRSCPAAYAWLLLQGLIVQLYGGDRSWQVTAEGEKWIAAVAT